MTKLSDSFNQKQWTIIHINGELSQMPQYNDNKGYKCLRVFEYESSKYNLYDIAIFDDQMHLYRFNNSLHFLNPHSNNLLLVFFKT